MTLRDDALYYREMGWVTTPLINDEQGYPKKPFVDGWQREVLGDVEGLPWQDAVGLGVVLGATSRNLAVIDLDDVELAEEAAAVCAENYFVRTARGRGHLYVLEAEPSASRVLKVPYHGRVVTVELKATGTQVAAPPSPGYSIWHQGSVLRASSVAQAFTELCTRLGIEAPPIFTAGYPPPWQHEVPVGDRNDAQFIEACHLAEAGMPFPEAVEIMRARFQVAYAKDPAKDRAGDKAMVRTIQSAYQRVAGRRLASASSPAAGGEVPAAAPPPEPAAGGSVVWMSQVEREEVHWLWRPYIPLGKLTLIEGDPGVGKSWLALALATAVSRGTGPAGMELAGSARTLILTAEDGIGDTVGPRLDLLGADSSRIAVLRPDVPVTLVDLEMLIIQVQPLLVVVDPLAAFLGRDIDMFRSNETRPVLAAVAAIAERHHCSVVIVRHITKGAAGRAIYRGQGTIDFTAAARSVLLAGADPEEPQKCALIHIKSNLAAKGDPLGYRLEASGFSWTGVSDLTASRILGGTEGTEAPSKLADAIDFLQQALDLDGQPAEQIKTAAKALDISERTLQRARETLGVRPVAIHRQEGKGILRWEWALPHLDVDSQTPYAVGGQVNVNGSDG